MPHFFPGIKNPYGAFPEGRALAVCLCWPSPDKRGLIVDQVIGFDRVVGQLHQLFHGGFGGQGALANLFGYVLNVLAHFGEHAQQGSDVLGSGVMQLIQRGLELGILFDVGLEGIGFLRMDVDGEVAGHGRSTWPGFRG